MNTWYIFIFLNRTGSVASLKTHYPFLQCLHLSACALAQPASHGGHSGPFITSTNRGLTGIVSVCRGQMNLFAQLAFEQPSDWGRIQYWHECWLLTLFKVYFIDYAITVVQFLFPFAPLSLVPPLHSHAHGCACKFFGLAISYTVLTLPLFCAYQLHWLLTLHALWSLLLWLLGELLEYVMELRQGYHSSHILTFHGCVVLGKLWLFQYVILFMLKVSACLATSQ